MSTKPIKPSLNSMRVANHIMATTLQRCAEEHAKRASMPHVIVHIGFVPAWGKLVGVCDPLPAITAESRSHEHEHDFLDAAFQIIELNNASLHVIYNGKCAVLGAAVGSK